MRSLFLSLACLLLLSTSCQKKEEDNSPPIPFIQQQLLAELNPAVIPIAPKPLELTDDALSALDILGEARIVGLGEATHGTKEFFEMKHRIFKYLVEQKGFRAFAFEMDFAEALIFNDYIHGRRNEDLTDLMNNKMIFWVWRTAEVRALLTWMREYNADKAEEERISFYGFDVQFPTYDANLLVDKLRAYDDAFAEEVNDLLMNYRFLDYDHYTTIDPADTLGIGQAVDSVYAQIVARKADITAALSDKSYELILQLARLTVQTQDMLFQTNRSNTNFRDLYMAENVDWLLDHLGGDEKIALWAHNLHVADYANYMSMGEQLKIRYEEDYQIVGFSFSKGYFNSTVSNLGVRNLHIDQAPRDKSVNELFHLAMPDNFILLLDDLSTESTLGEWLSESKPFLSIGSRYNGDPNFYYQSLRLKKVFDVMIHFEETKASDIL